VVVFESASKGGGTSFDNDDEDADEDD